MRKSFILLTICALAGLWSCQSRIEDETPITYASDESEVEITVAADRTPRNVPSATPDENIIDNLDILLFDSNGKFICWRATFKINGKLRTTLPVGKDYDAYFLANCRSFIGEMLPDKATEEQYRQQADWEVFRKTLDVIQQIVGRHNRVVNQASPIVDTRLSDGSRVNIVLNPISIGGSAVSIRKFPEHPMSMERLVEIEALSPEVARLLQILTQAKYNIFISGGTGSGKTTFLNALSQYIPDDERIITIEDSAELQLLGAKNIVRLETRNANTDGVTPITIRDLIRTALRMRPDRIIVGECRGAEALDMLQAMNTGHDGSLSTGHANSPHDIISRIETMVLQGQDFPLNAIRQQIASGIDIIVQLGRLRDKSRRVLEISEVDGFMDGEIVLHTLYRFEETAVLDSGRIQGFLKKAGTLCHTDKLMAAGLSV